MVEKKIDRNWAILKDRANGDRYVDIAIRYGISAPRVTQIVHATVASVYEHDPLKLLTVFNEYNKLKYVFNPTRTYKVKYTELYDICWLPKFNCAEYASTHDIPMGYCYYLTVKYKAMRYMRAVERYYSDTASIKKAGYTVKEIARMMNIPTGAVRKYVKDI